MRDGDAAESSAAACGRGPGSRTGRPTPPGSPGGRLNFGREPALRLGDEAALVAPADVGADADLPLVLPARDDAGAVGDPDLGQRAKAAPGPVRGGHQNVADPGQRAARLGHVANDDVERRSPSNIVLTGRPPMASSITSCTSRDVDAVARHFLPVDLDAELGLVGLLLDGGVGGARNARAASPAPGPPWRAAAPDPAR